MAFHFTPSESARYLVAFQLAPSASQPGRLFKLFCDTIADVQDRLAFNLRSWGKDDGSDEFFTCLSNGYKPNNVPAGMVKNQTRRYGFCLVAKRTGFCRETGELRTEEAVVIALR